MCEILYLIHLRTQTHRIHNPLCHRELFCRAKLFSLCAPFFFLNSQTTSRLNTVRHWAKIASNFQRSSSISAMQHTQWYGKILPLLLFQLENCAGVLRIVPAHISPALVAGSLRRDNKIILQIVLSKMWPMI